MSDYLWDKSGEPDPEIQRLEQLLTPLSHRNRPWTPRRRNPAWPFAIAASILIATGGVWWSQRASGPAWQVSALAGHPSVARLATGQSLQTDAVSRARLELEGTGEIDVDPNTRLRAVTLRPDQQRLHLQRGVIHARIWAPPARFYVDTPSAVTVDLGCAYTLQVDETGAALVRVTMGWVAFEGHGWESFIPQAAACRTMPGHGPGIPYYDDAYPALRQAVERFDLSASAESRDRILAAARPRDALTLWHLLRRVPPPDRARVFDRLSTLIAIPPGIARSRILTADPAAIDALWDALDLGGAGWWRPSKPALHRALQLFQR